MINYQILKIAVKIVNKKVVSIRKDQRIALLLYI